LLIFNNVVLAQINFFFGVTLGKLKTEKLIKKRGHQGSGQKNTRCYNASLTRLPLA
jgi:hypothetical protein